MKGFRRSFSPLEILSRQQIDAMREGTLQILAGTGIRMEHARGREVLYEAGCHVDRATNRVRIPADVATRCLSLCPRTFRVRALDPGNDILIGGDALYFVSGCGLNTVDISTWQARPATRQETIDGIRVLDALENLHLFLAFSPYFGWQDLPPVMGEPQMTATKARFSAKVQMTGSTNDSEVFAIKIARVTGCDVLGIVNPSPPLTWYGEAVEALFRYCEADIPFHVSSGGTMGLTAPASIAGAVIATSAELMTGIVMAQTLRPGARVWVGNFVNAANMTNGSIAFGSIASSLTQAAFNQLWRAFGVPVWGAGPAYSSAKSMDFQCGAEKAMAAILAGVCGSHAIHMHGGLHAELTWHPLQAILDDDIAGMVGRFLQGVETTPEALALDTIARVGPIPGHFLEEESTLLGWKSVDYIPRAADRTSAGDWIAQGKRSAVDLARQRLEDILARQTPALLSADQDRAIEEILREARIYYEQRGLL